MGMRELITDIESLKDGDRIELHPNDQNPLHKSPFVAMFNKGYFCAENSDPFDGPDYYWRDVLAYNHGWRVLESDGKRIEDGDQ